MKPGRLSFRYLVILALMAAALLGLVVIASGYPENALPVVPGSEATGTRSVAASDAIVHAVLFWKVGCHFCEQTISVYLPPIYDTYGSQFELLMLQIVTSQDVDDFFRLVETYDLPEGAAGVPFLIIGEHVLIGPQRIHAELPALIDGYLAQGGMELPANDVLTGILAAHAPVPTFHLSASTQVLSPAGALPASAAPSAARPDGFWLAVAVMAFMIAIMLYAVVSVFWSRSPSLAGRWREAALPILALVGLGVAVYLSYVEIRAVSAVCGLVGDCNAVQSSPYARLFGFLPIGILGAAGYILILVAWISNHWAGGTLKRYVDPALFGMAFFGTLFSIYLTYLELFVIQAVCLWCLSSAIVISIVLAFSLSSLRSWLNETNEYT